MAANLLGGSTPKSLTLVGTTLRLTYETCCDDEDQVVSVNLGSLGGGTGSLVYLIEEGGNAGASPVEPVTPPVSPFAGDVVLEKFDDFLIGWSYDGATWTEEWRIASNDSLQASATATANPNTWSTTTGRITLIYNSSTGISDFLGYTDSTGVAHPAHHPKYIELSNGQTGYGADPENPTKSELDAAITAQSKPIPLPGDIIQYTAPSSFRYIYDVRRDDGGVTYEYQRRNHGLVQTVMTGGTINPDNTSTWSSGVGNPSIQPQIKVIASQARGLILGLVDSNGVVLRVPTHQRVEMGKYGIVSTDADSIDDLPMHPLSSPTNGSWRIKFADCVLSTAAAGSTIFAIYKYANPTASAVLVGSFTITAGNFTVTMASIVDVSIASGSYLALKVTTGSTGTNLNVSLLLEN